MPVEPMESMLRPFNLVIPFTVQKGELTGTVLGPRGRRARRGHFFQAQSGKVNYPRLGQSCNSDSSLLWPCSGFLSLLQAVSWCLGQQGQGGLG